MGAVRRAEAGVLQVAVAVDVLDLRQKAHTELLVEGTDDLVAVGVALLLFPGSAGHASGRADVHDVDLGAAGDPGHGHQVVVGDVLLHDRSRGVARVIVTHPQDDLRLVVDGVETAHLKAGDEGGREVNKGGAPLEVPEDAAVLLQEVVDEFPVVADLTQVRGAGVSDEDGLLFRALNDGRDGLCLDGFGLGGGEGGAGHGQEQDHGHGDGDRAEPESFFHVIFLSSGLFFARKNQLLQPF